MRDGPGLRRSLLAMFSVAVMIAGGAAHGRGSPAYDTIIRGGTIVDGSGLAPYRGDVAIDGGYIVAVGRLAGARAAATIDATGLVVAPGFINIHSHARPDAVGTGLDYQPAFQADADEVVGILSVAAKWRTNFPIHERLRAEEGYSSFKGMAETVSIARAAGVMPVITHLKTQGVEQGSAPAVIAMMDAATAQGTYTAADAYPYLAGHASLALLIPGWAQDGGRDALLKRLADPATRARIVAERKRR